MYAAVAKLLINHVHFVIAILKVDYCIKYEYNNNDIKKYYQKLYHRNIIK